MLGIDHFSDLQKCTKIIAARSAASINVFIPLRKTINMKPLTIACFFALLVLLAACNDTATDASVDAAKTDSPATAAATPPPGPELDSATKAKNWQEYMTPGDVHKMVASWDGTWKADMTMYMPGAPPQVAPGKSVNKTILDGRYQTSVYTCTMMGMPFEGRSTMGYDNHKKLFVSTWIDNMGSGIMTGEGPWDEASKTITIKGKMMDAETRTEKDYRQVMKIIDDNNQFMEMYGAGPDGKEVKFFEIKYTRGK
jgi:hypothetical protein